MVRRVVLAGTDIETSAIGFGCASLGSRISRAQGLRALAEAHEGGVTWFDVAPPYGAGEAEAILGTFVKGRRDAVQLCTKVGLTDPGRNGLMKLVYTLARPVVGRMRGLRQRFRAMPSTRYRQVTLDGPTMTASLERSLKRLGTDHVDVFALHDPGLDDVIREETLRALEDILRTGKARHVSVAGTLPACIAGVSQPRPFTVAQFADPPGAEALAQVQAAAGRPIATITHSVFGVDGAHRRLAQRLAGDPLAARLAANAGYGGAPETAAAEILLDRALAANESGVVLASMFGAEHRKLNLARAQRAVSPEAVTIARSLLGPREAETLPA
ncbi:aldo/keto reductase family protein [Ancylobacter terrae]|uniref:aldo/keto reductase family protein n=1 Tax=Ancylobacter sp. sgz301288 TaxID=3342077 RepID=UPI00385EEDD9